MRKVPVLLALVLLFPPLARAGEKEFFTRKSDIVYGRKFGTALTLDVFAPKEKKNGLGLVWVVSGGWFSSHQSIRSPFAEEFLKRGYTVFAVVHGSQPRYTIPEVLEDMHRAVRFLRHHARDFAIDPERIGIYGGSAGGHLSLMQGTRGRPGDAKSKDPVERSSSKVQAVACFFPPTDFLNYGKKGEKALGSGVLKGFKAPFDFHRFVDGRFQRIEDEAEREKIGREISPVYHIQKSTPPCLILHGDADKLVPIQQAEIFVAGMKEKGAVGELVVRPGAAHGWPNLLADLSLFADWFDRHLKK